MISSGIPFNCRKGVIDPYLMKHKSTQANREYVKLLTFGARPSCRDQGRPLRELLSPFQADLGHGSRDTTRWDKREVSYENMEQSLTGRRIAGRRPYRRQGRSLNEDD